MIATLFSITSFLAAALLFSVEPMIGKMVLPIFGGTPGVWNACLLYFQAMLLSGYLLAHGASVAVGEKGRSVSLMLLSALALLVAAGYHLQPIAFRPEIGTRVASGEQPALVLLMALISTGTIPLSAVCATAPLVQTWFASTGHRQAHDPYFLYAASNAGSLLALLSYPVAVEPNLGLAAQSQVWRFGFAVLGALLLLCGLAAELSSARARTKAPVRDPDSVPDSAGRSFAAPKERPGWTTRLWWIVLVFIPSSWLMGVTTYLTTDLAPIPLLWTIPLALYLLSFMLAFARSTIGVVAACSHLFPYLVVPLVLVMSAGFVHVVWVPLHLLTFLAGAVACHGALAEARPPVRFATLFYVTIAVGGLLGGVWNALVAPLVFSRIIEYPLAMILACLVTPGVHALRASQTLRDWLGDLLPPAAVFLLTALLATNQAGLADSALGILGVMAVSGLGLYSCLNARRRPVGFALVIAAVPAATGLAPGPSGRLLHIERDFFGVLRVTHDAAVSANRLFHGSTLHGQQSLVPALRREPSTYFTRAGPIGQVFEVIKPRLDQQGAQVAIVGLGAGTLASYARPGQHWTFYEIDAEVQRIAQDTRYFTYLKDSQADSLKIVLGDARLRLRDAPEDAYGLIVLDAFSSDALPVHLISREAIRLYVTKLAERGLLAFNLSNRYLDLDLVMARQAQDAGLVYRVRHDLRVSAEEKEAGKQPSIWAVMGLKETDLGSLADDPRWKRPAPRPHSAGWTDDYSDVASYLILKPGWLRAREKTQPVSGDPEGIAEP
jgi:hypothetical protein